MALNYVPLSKKSEKGSLTSEPYLARIVSHIDPTFQGGFEVSLIRETGNELGDGSQTYIVRYASPFYGCTSYEFTGKNVEANDSQASYGFWGVPPDVGVTGIVIFINGHAARGFWIASVQDKFTNHMIPAIASSKNYESKNEYEQGEHPLPVVEHNRKANEMEKNLEIDKIKRAVHPFAEKLKQQGLVRDEFRGHSTSTVRRDLPNMVFGISSPGPIDRNGKKAILGTKQHHTDKPVSVGRLGGTQFVMDDGDDRYYRSKAPTEGPPEYKKFLPNGLSSKDAKLDAPYNEHFRIRTRTGHQILLHNSEDLIYIGNSRGTAWIELSSDGKIDIYAQDSVSIRTKADFNFYADRDFNLEVGRNINIKAGGEWHSHVEKDWNVLVGKDGKITLGGNLDTNAEGHIYETSGKSNETKAGGNIYETSDGHNETKAGGQIIETGKNIHMNGPSANKAAKAEKVKKLTVHKLPDLKKPSAAEEPTEIKSILRRVITPEPYPHHENSDPKTYNIKNTDRDTGGRTEKTTEDLKQPPSSWKKYNKPKDNPF